MAQVIDERVTAEIDGAFVVFLVGMRVKRTRGRSSSTGPLVLRTLRGS